MSQPTMVREEDDLMKDYFLLIKHYILQLTDGFVWKSLAGVAITIFTSIQGFYGELLWGFLGLFLLDLLSGILKSWINKVPITSRKLRDSVVKLGGYVILITALIVLSKYEDTVQPVIAWAYYYFMFTEGKSIFENVQAMGVKLPGFLMILVNGRLKALDKLDPNNTKQKEDKKDAE